MPLTDRATPSIYLQAKKLVQQAVIALHLDGLNEKEIVIREWPWTETNIFRGITVWGNKLGNYPGSNYRLGNGYAVVLSMILLADGATAGDEASDRLPLWKSSIKRRFHDMQVPGLAWPGATHNSCTFQDWNLKIPAKHQAGGTRFVGDQCIIWYWVRESKDFGD